MPVSYTHLDVYKRQAINRLGIDVVLQRYGNLFDMYEEITDVNPGELAKEINGVKYYNPVSYTHLYQHYNSRRI